MQLWGNPSSGQPLRDSSFDSDIVIRKYSIPDATQTAFFPGALAIDSWLM